MKAPTGIKMALVALILALTASVASASGGLVWHTATVDSSGDRGTHTSIAFDPVTGIPWISYYDEGNKDLMVAHRVGSGGNCGPNNEWYCETVDSSGDVGQNSSIGVYIDPAVIGSLRVGVAYQYAPSQLRFAEYSCLLIPPWTCSWSLAIVDQGDAGGLPGYGRYTSIKYDSGGKPHIAYYVVRWEGDISISELRYAYRVSSGGNCGAGSAAGKWHCETVDSGAGQYASLDFNSSGTPYIAYYNGAAGDLKYAYYAGIGNCGTSNAWYCTTLDSAGDVGQSASLRLVGNAPRIAYYDATNGKLRYAAHVGSGGNCGPGNSFLCYTIEDAASPSGNRSISLATDGADHPLIAYRYGSGLGGSQLRVAQPASDPLSANCGVPDGGFFPTWQCLTVDTAGTLFGIASHVSAAFDPHNLPMIAYSKWYYNPIGGSSDYDLKITYGRIGVFLPLVLRNYP